jgi:hypothetical protein
MKKNLTLTFLAGIAIGAVLYPNWRVVAKKAIKTGIKGGRKLMEFSQQAMEDIEDVTAEAVRELDEQEKVPSAESSV